jgi:hypothetical protein
LLVSFKFLLQEIGEKEEFKYSKQYKKLEKDNYPGFFAPPWHISETVVVKMK